MPMIFARVYGDWVKSELKPGEMIDTNGRHRWSPLVGLAIWFLIDLPIFICTCGLAAIAVMIFHGPDRRR